IREVLGVELPLRRLFERPTLADVAANVERAFNPLEASKRPGIRPIARRADLLASFTEQRLVFLQQFDPESCHYNIAYAVRLSGDLDAAALEEGLNEVVKRHEALRTTFRVVEGNTIRVIAEPSKQALPMVDLSHFADAEQEAQRKIREEGRKPFDLSVGP